MSDQPVESQPVGPRAMAVDPGPGPNAAAGIALIGVFAALIAAFSLVPAIPLPIGVPITLQTLAVALAGLVLGPWRGFLATLLYVAVGLAGLPVFAGGAAGLAVLGKPSVGYLVAFPIGALVTGAVARGVRAGRSGELLRLFLAALIGAGLVVHLAGVAGLMASLRIDLLKALTIDAAFVIGDVIKFFIAAGIAIAVRRAFPRLLSGA